MKGQPGNGSSKFQVQQDDMGGWVRVHASGSSFPANLPVILSACLTDWFRQRLHLRLRFVIPIQKDGNTVELHAWYECQTFPPTDLSPKPSK
jgi:hypothetical protein